jgi:hypothetical protein
MRSAETTGPTVVRRRCSAIGPSWVWSAAASLPISPLVGIVVPPSGVGLGLGLGDALADGEALGDGEGEGLGLGLGLGLGDGEGDGLALGGALPDGFALADPDGAADAEPAALGDALAGADADAEALGAADAEALGDADGLSVGTGVGVGTGAGRPMGRVRMMKNPSVEAVTVESARPCPMRTFLMPSAVTFGFAKRTSHSVPPV